MSTEIGKARVKVEFDNESVNEGIDATKGGVLSRLGNLGALGGAALAAGIIAGAVAAGTALYGVGKGFDDVTDTIRVGTGAQGAALDGLVDVARNVGAQVPAEFDAISTTVADLNTRLGLSGDTLETVGAQYLEAGRILGSDVDIQATSAAFSAFGIEGEGVIDAMDTLFQVSQATGVVMNELAAATQQNAPALQALGFSFEETTALVGSLDKAGLNVGQTMSSMSRGMVTLARDGEAPAEAFQRVVGEIEGFIAAGDTASAVDLASQVFGTRGATQMVGAIQSGTLALGDLVGAAGLTQDTILGLGTETMDAAESWQVFKNQALLALEPVGSAIYGVVGDAFASLAGSGVMDRFAGFLSGIGDAIAGLDLGGVLAGIDLGAILQVLSPIGTLVRAMAPVFPVLAQAITQVGRAIGGALLAVLPSLTPIFASITDVVTTLAPVLGDLAAVAADVLGEAIAAVTPVLVEIADVLAGALAQVLPVIADMMARLAPIVGQVFAALTPLIPPILSIVEAFIPLLPLVADLVSALLPPLVDLFVAVLEPVIGLVGALAEGLAPVLQVVATALAETIEWVVGLVEGFVGLLTGTIDVGDRLSDVWGAISSTAQDVWNNLIGFVGALPGRIWDGLRSIATTVHTNVVGAVAGIRDGIQAKFTEAVDWVGGIPGRILGALGDLGTILLGAGRAIMEGLWNGLREKWEDVQDWVGGIGDWIADHKGPRAYDLSLLQPAGSWIIQGLLTGLEDGIPQLRATLARVTDEISVGVPSRFAAVTVADATATDDEAGAVGAVHIDHLTLSADDVREFVDLADFAGSIRRLAQQRGGVGRG